MIVFEERGDIFKSGMQTLVCPVNTEGAMGAGLAKSFRDRFGGLLDAYRRACRIDVFQRKGVFVYNHGEDCKIACIATKRRWKENSKLAWVEWGLECLAADYKEYGIESIAVPALGCGLGRLEWEDVRPLIVQYLHPLPIPVAVYSP